MEKKGRSAKKVGVFKKVAAAVTPGVKKVVRKKSGPDQAEFNRRVTEKAYQLYISRGAGHGDDMADWLEAERLVRAEQ